MLKFFRKKVNPAPDVATDQGIVPTKQQAFANAVVRYFNKLGHACVCDLLEHQQILHILVTITSPPNESAAAVALAARRIEERIAKAVSMPVRVFITFRNPRLTKDGGSKAAAPSTSQRREVEVGELDFAEYERHYGAG